MNDYRMDAASTVFEGRVVVSGGCNANGLLRSVEAYDHVADKWSYMPSLIHGSCDHNMSAVSNKLYALGCGFNSDIIEVYDTFCKKFFVVSKLPKFIDCFYHTSITLGRKILVFRNEVTKVAIYDVDKNEWLEESFEVIKNISNFQCLKIPIVKL